MNVNILVVDDSTSARMIIGGMLKDYNVLTARDGREAMQIIDSNQDIDLIILDLNMPNMDGFEVLKILKSDSRYANLRTIILTNYDEIDNEIKGLKAGAIDYIRKPVNIESLRVRIDIHLKLKNMQDIVEHKNELLDSMVHAKTKEIEEMYNKINESERSKSMLLANLPGMAYRCAYTREWTMQFVSEGCSVVTGYKAESLLNNKDLSFNSLIVPEYRERVWDEWVRVITLKAPFRYEYEILTADGQRKWVLELAQGVYKSDGTVDALEGIIIDITEQKQKELQIQYLNYHDYLTGLYNRRFFEEELKNLDREEFLPLSIIIFDINGVRLINDAFGYSEGDRLIVETANLLKNFCRQGDILARMGGDEFAVLLPNTSMEAAAVVNNSISELCNSFNQNNVGKLYDISFSSGLATKETIAQSIFEIQKSADAYLKNRKLFNRKSIRSNLISSIMATVYEKSAETEEHAQRIAELSKMIGKRLNLSANNIGELELFSMLHDIGKVGIDDRILKKPGKLASDEWIVMKTHTEIGYRIANSASELESIAEYILTHHERWDGKGYPQGLIGDEIPILSRIVAVADSFDAMTNDRVYRRAMDVEAAIEEIKNNSGTQFDPQIVDIFSDIIYTYLSGETETSFSGESETVTHK